MRRYFNAAKDDDGDPLMADQEYSIMLPASAPQIPCRWWSITVYGTDHFLIDNKVGKYSVNMKDVNRNALTRASASNAQNGKWRWRFELVPDECCEDAGNAVVLPMGARRHERVFLTLRLYNPDPTLQQHSHRGIRTAVMPRILKKLELTNARRGYDGHMFASYYSTVRLPLLSLSLSLFSTLFFKKIHAVVVWYAVCCPRDNTHVILVSLTFM